MRPSPILQTATGSSNTVDQLAETGSSPLSGKLKSFLKDLIYDESTNNKHHESKPSKKEEKRYKDINSSHKI